jgi:hypothetical protein
LGDIPNSRNALAIKKQASYGSSDAHIYKVPPCKDHRGVDLTSDALLFGALWYTKPDDAVEYAKFFRRSHDAVMRVYDECAEKL